MADRTLGPQSGRGEHPPLHGGGWGEQCTVLLKHQVRWLNYGVVHGAHRKGAPEEALARRGRGGRHRPLPLD